MYTYMYKHMYIYVYIHVYTHVYVHIYVYIYINIYKSPPTNTHTSWTRTHTHAHVKFLPECLSFPHTCMRNVCVLSQFLFSSTPPPTYMPLSIKHMKLTTPDKHTNIHRDIYICICIQIYIYLCTCTIGYRTHATNHARSRPKKIYVYLKIYTLNLNRIAKQLFQFSLPHMCYM